MRKKEYVLVTLTTVLLTMAVMKAHAIYTETQLTPTVLKDGWASYTVQAKEIKFKGNDAVKEFVVTVTPLPGRKLSPARGALLEIIDGSSTLAFLPLEEKQTGGKLTFWFRVAPKVLADTRFSFRQNGYTQTKDGKGNTVVVGLPGGAGAYFFLRDFAEPMKQ